MLGFTVTGIASERLLKHELRHNAERLALAREHTELLTFLKREAGKKLLSYSTKKNYFQQDIRKYEYVVAFTAAQRLKPEAVSFYRL